jgi:hypothetical protein
MPATENLDPDAVTAAVAASHAAPAPAGALEQDLASVTSRLETVEATVAAHAPAIAALQDVATSVAEAEIPSAAPWIARVEALEQWALGVISHFQGKIPPLPPTPPAA